MGMMINRRRYMGKKSYLPDYTLAYYWEASDGIVDGYWTDRVSGMRLTPHGSPTLENGMFKVRWWHTGEGSAYFDLNLNNPGIYMGDIWQIDIEFIITTNDEWVWVADFSCLQQSDHAFGFAYQRTLSGLYFNTKLTGNLTASLYYTNVPFSNFGNLSSVSMGIEKVSDNVYLPYYIVDGTRYDSPNTTTQEGATFNANWDGNDKRLLVGRGIANGYNSSSWKYIKSIKIYKKDTN